MKLAASKEEGVSTEFEDRLRGGSLLTAEIIYYRPDHPSLLQSFAWQTIDAGPRFRSSSHSLSTGERKFER